MKSNPLPPSIPSDLPPIWNRIRILQGERKSIHESFGDARLSRIRISPKDRQEMIIRDLKISDEIQILRNLEIRLRRSVG